MQIHIENLPKEITALSIRHWLDIKNIKSTELKLTEINSDEFQATINQLIATCLSDDGIGLAAPQVGIFKRIIVCRDFLESEDGKHNLLPTFQVYINPNFEPILENKKSEMKEYCLSVPDGGLNIARWNSIKITWHELSSDKKDLHINTKLVTGFQARVFQHEFDHLNGISIPQRWQLQNKKPDTKKRKK